MLRFADRLLLTLTHLRLGLPHEALAAAFAVDRSTVTRAIGQIRPLLAGRGCALPSGVRLRTLADVFAYAADAYGATLWCGSTRRTSRSTMPGLTGGSPTCRPTPRSVAWWSPETVRPG
ncbi:transposase family protein [Planosporangium sp. 12N6]|uniref:transposase family protein n=1 Tax=Planosporangium spinosum TaxID=3402278 RepID=UPI003CF3480F